MAHQVVDDSPMTYQDILKRDDFPEWKESLLEEINDIELFGDCEVIAAADVPEG